MKKELRTDSCYLGLEETNTYIFFGIMRYELDGRDA
jgi:hypothetical protein